MKGIKYTLTFVGGMLYSSAWHMVLSAESLAPPVSTPTGLVIMFLASSTIATVLMSIKFLADHWDEE